jgi:hypothetical protein
MPLIRYYDPRRHHCSSSCRPHLRSSWFESAYVAWEAMRVQDKTWVNFKIHFGAADATQSKILLLQTPSAPTTYPGSANSATSTSTAYASFSSGITHDGSE